MTEHQPRHSDLTGAAVGSWMMGLAMASSVGTAAVLAMVAGGGSALLGAATDLPRPELPPALPPGS